MTNFEKIKSMTKEEFVKWLDEHGEFDHSPWNDWFDWTYCKKCEPIKCRVPDLGNKEVKCNFCELEDYCKFFENNKTLVTNDFIISLWLDEEFS